MSKKKNRKRKRLKRLIIAYLLRAIVILMLNEYSSKRIQLQI